MRSFIEQAPTAGESGGVFAGQISGRAQQIYGEEWGAVVRKDAKAKVWSPPIVATLLHWWPDTRATWDEVAALGTEGKAEYWRRQQVGLIEGSIEDQTDQINQLIEVRRAGEVRRTALDGEILPADTMLRIFDATLDALATAQTAEEGRRLGPDSYDVRQFLEQRRTRAEIPREELARREYQGRPLLDPLNVGGLTIHEFMAEDPNFFVDILCDAYLPAHRDKRQDAEPNAEMQVRAQAAYTLIPGMHRIPGPRSGRDIDQAVLLQWLRAVRTRAAARDRAAIADQQSDIASPRPHQNPRIPVGPMASYVRCSSAWLPNISTVASASNATICAASTTRRWMREAPKSEP